MWSAAEAIFTHRCALLSIASGDTRMTLVQIVELLIIVAVLFFAVRLLRKRAWLQRNSGIESRYRSRPDALAGISGDLWQRTIRMVAGFCWSISTMHVAKHA